MFGFAWRMGPCWEQCWSEPVSWGLGFLWLRVLSPNLEDLHQIYMLCFHQRHPSRNRNFGLWTGKMLWVVHRRMNPQCNLKGAAWGLCPPMECNFSLVVADLWEEHVWWHLPANDLLQVRGASRRLHSVLAPMERAWDTLLREILNMPLWVIVTEGLKIPGVDRSLVSRLQWDFSWCHSLEEMWFSDAEMFSISKVGTLMQWKEINTSHKQAVDYLAAKARKSGKRVQMTQETATWWNEMTEFVFQLEYGPARAWLSFFGNQGDFSKCSRWIKWVWKWCQWR